MGEWLGLENLVVPLKVMLVILFLCQLKLRGKNLIRYSEAMVYVMEKIDGDEVYFDGVIGEPYKGTFSYYRNVYEMSGLGGYFISDILITNWADFIGGYYLE